MTRVALNEHVKAHGVAGRAFVVEALARLDQLHWLCERIAHVERDAVLVDWQVWEKSSPNEICHPSVVELQTLTEAFYYIAWRLISLLDRKDAPIPSLRGLRSSCKGIRTVRNMLLEHPESADSRIHVPAIMYGTNQGPVLKCVAEVRTSSDGRNMFRTTRADLLDKGLWANAEELKMAIEDRMKRHSLASNTK